MFSTLFRGDDIRICLYFTLKESRLKLRSLSKIFLFMLASLEDSMLLPILVEFDFIVIKNFSLEEIA